MPFKSNLATLVDDTHQGRTYAEIAAAPIGVLGELTHGQAAKINEALDIWTIEELATCKPVLWGQAITQLADEEPLDIGREKPGPVFNPSLITILDRQWAEMPLRELAKAPVSALRGVSKDQASLLKAAIQVESLRDLATHRSVLVAQVITQLARFERVETVKQAA